jgi:hypothetical protein
VNRHFAQSPPQGRAHWGGHVRPFAAPFGLGLLSPGSSARDPGLTGVAGLLARQGRLYFLEAIEVFLQAADVLLHVRDGRAELAYSSKGAPEAAGKLRTGARHTHRTVDITEREHSEQHPDHRDTFVARCRAIPAMRRRGGIAGINVTELSRHLLKIAEAVTSPVGRCRLVVNCMAMTYRFRFPSRQMGPSQRLRSSLCGVCAILTTVLY